jgi:hypothetical protein
VVRQHRQDLGVVVAFMRDLNSRQSQLFFLIATLIARYKSSELESIIDDDVAEAAGTLAATYETAARGVIYEHRPTSVPAGRLATALKAAFAEAAGGVSSVFERDAALILRRIEDMARRIRELDQAKPRALIGLLERAVQNADEAPTEAPTSSRLIVP